MNASPLLVEALVYLAAGVLAVPLARQAGLGAVLGYLVAGVLIGPFALGLVGGQAAVMQFAEFGVVILLFLIGLEVRPALLWRLRFDIAGLGLAQLLGAALAIGLAAWAAGLTPRAAIASGVILAMSSTAVTLQLLDENGLRRGAVGTSAFGVLLFQDLSVIPLFALLPLLASGGGHAVSAGVAAGGSGVSGHGLLDGVSAPVRTAAELAAVLSVVLGGRLLTRPAFRFIAAARLREIFTATALLIVVGVAALMEIVGLSPALGTFLAGVMLAESEFRRELEADIEPFRGLLLGLFFMTVGASVDLRLVLHHPFLLLGAVAGLLAIKTVVMLLIGRVARLPWRDSLTVAVALAEGGEFAFVLVSAAIAASVIDRRTGALLVATVALSMLASPALFRLTRRRTRAPAAGVPAEALPAFEEGADAIVAGYGRVGQIVGRLLRSAGFRCTVLDVSMSTIETIRALGGRVEYGDATRLDLLEAAGARTARLLVVAIDDRERATELVTLARTTFPNLTVIARAWDRQHAYALMEQGAAHVERETYEGSLALGRAALRALGYRAHRAQRVAALFRLYDGKQFDRMRARRGEARPAFLLATRESAAMFAELLAADLAALGGGEASDTDWAAAGSEEPHLP